MIGIIDYGAGNTQSVINALERVGVQPKLSNNIEELQQCSRIILPGVGHAKPAMERLQETRLIEFIKEWDRPFLGICLGMQLMCEHSQEGNTPCLGILDAKVKKFENETLSIPAMGWMTLTESRTKIFSGISINEFYYFVHSYFVTVEKETIGLARYGVNFSAAIQKDNFYGVQFHPEKSAKAGLQLLTNFINL